MIVTLRHDFISGVLEEDDYQFHYNKTTQGRSLLWWVAVALLGETTSLKVLKVSGEFKYMNRWKSKRRRRHKSVIWRASDYLFF